MSKLEESTLPDNIMGMTAEIVAAYVRNNSLASNQLPEVIGIVFRSFQGLRVAPAPVVEEPARPAVSIKRSITPDYLICLEDGKQLKTLKRHLRSTYNMSPDDYRAKWQLPADYPMVAPNYAAQRSAFARKIGLGKGSGRKALKR